MPELLPYPGHYNDTLCSGRLKSALEPGSHSAGKLCSSSLATRPVATLCSLGRKNLSHGETASLHSRNHHTLSQCAMGNGQGSLELGVACSCCLAICCGSLRTGSEASAEGDSDACKLRIIHDRSSRSVMTTFWELAEQKNLAEALA